MNLLTTIKYTQIYLNYYLWKSRKSFIGKVTGFDKLCENIEIFCITKTLINKKKGLKDKLDSFNKNLYFYLSLKIIPDSEKKANEFIEQEQGVRYIPEYMTESESQMYLKSLYKDYIYFINKSLSFNQEYIKLDRLQYFLIVHKDLINSQLNPFIDQKWIGRDIEELEKLKIIIERIYYYSLNNDYFTEEEFTDFLKDYREFFFIDNIDIFKNLGKIPKRLKRKQRMSI